MGEFPQLQEILRPVLAGFGALQFFWYLFSAADPGSSLSVCQPDCCFCPSSLAYLVRAAPQPFTAVTSAGAAVSAGLCVAAASVFSVPIPAPLFAQVCLPSEVSMHDVSDAFVCGAENPLSNCSCPT